MKVFQINASYKPAFIYGGPTMSVSKLSEELIRNGVDLEVLTTTANGPTELSTVSGTPVNIDSVPVTYFRRLTKDHTHFSPALYRTLSRKLSKLKHSGENTAIVHIHTWWNLVSVISCLIAVLHKIPVVLSPRGTLSSYSFGNKNNFIKNIIFKLSQPLFRRCHFHVTSENEKNAIVSLTPFKSISLIPNLVSLPDPFKILDTQERKSYETKGQFNLLFLSRIEEKKGLELLFLALRGLRLKYRLNIAGSGEHLYVERLRDLARSFHIDASIKWLGHQSADEKFDLIAESDMLILPSYDENFANVVIESLAMGTPVLVTENVGLSDYIRNEDLGWVCQSDATDLKGKIEDAFHDQEKREKIRQIAPEKIRSDYSDGEVCTQYIRMYKRILTSFVTKSKIHNL